MKLKNADRVGSVSYRVATKTLDFRRCNSYYSILHHCSGVILNDEKGVLSGKQQNNILRQHLNEKSDFSGQRSSLRSMCVHL